MWKTDLKTKEARETCSLIAKLNQTEVIISLEQGTIPLCFNLTFQYKSITGFAVNGIPKPFGQTPDFLDSLEFMYESKIDR